MTDTTETMEHKEARMEPIHVYGPTRDVFKTLGTQFMAHLSAGVDAEIERLGLDPSDPDVSSKIGQARINVCICVDCTWLVRYASYSCAMDMVQRDHRQAVIQQIAQAFTGGNTDSLAQLLTQGVVPVVVSGHDHGEVEEVVSADLPTGLFL